MRATLHAVPVLSVQPSADTAGGALQPALTVRESFQFSAECRLQLDDQKQLQEFVDEVRKPVARVCQLSSAASVSCCAAKQQHEAAP